MTPVEEDGYYRAALRLLPFLVRCAREGGTMTYKEAARAIGWKGEHAMGYVCGRIRDDICQPRGLPWISALVVKTATNLPGHNFLPEGTEGMSKEEIRKRWQQLRDAVLREDGWEKFLADLNLTPLKPSPKSLDEQARAYSNMERRRGGGESPRHKRLKDYIAARPSVLGLSGKASVEYVFPSDDVCDVVVKLRGGGHAVVEVKLGDLDGELWKGVYQAVKYRALMEAVKGEGKPYPVKAFLVAYHIPDDIKKRARRLEVETVQIDERKAK